VQLTHTLFEADDSIVTLTLNRPERRNTLSLEVLTELRDAFRRIGEGAEGRAPLRLRSADISRAGLPGST